MDPLDLLKKTVMRLVEVNRQNIVALVMRTAFTLLQPCVSS